MINFKVMSRTVGPILLLEALMLLPAAGISLFDGDMREVYGKIIETYLKTKYERLG